ncbi:hypothetical protein CFPU101_49320 [Chroococcus sp. FPU101]|nr:hypothetical protein CFPU101_49320 [Chroococcus sp. FPU101]
MFMYFEPYKDENNQWVWRLWSPDGSEVMAYSGKSYAKYSECLEAIRFVKCCKDALVHAKTDTFPSAEEILRLKGFK